MVRTQRVRRGGQAVYQTGSRLTFIAQDPFAVDDRTRTDGDLEDRESVRPSLALDEEVNAVHVDLVDLVVIRRRVLRRPSQRSASSRGAQATSSRLPHLDEIVKPAEDFKCLILLPVEIISQRERDPVAALVGPVLEDRDPVGDVLGVVSEVHRERRVIPEDLHRVLRVGRELFSLSRR